jgi:hypothetical protein
MTLLLNIYKSFGPICGNTFMKLGFGCDLLLKVSIRHCHFLVGTVNDKGLYIACSKQEDSGQIVVWSSSNHVNLDRYPPLGEALSCLCTAYWKASTPRKLFQSMLTQIPTWKGSKEEESPTSPPLKKAKKETLNSFYSVH